MQIIRRMRGYKNIPEKDGTLKSHVMAYSQSLVYIYIYIYILWARQRNFYSNYGFLGNYEYSRISNRILANTKLKIRRHHVNKLDI